MKLQKSNRERKLTSGLKNAENFKFLLLTARARGPSKESLLNTAEMARHIGDRRKLDGASLEPEAQI